MFSLANFREVGNYSYLAAQGRSCVSPKGKSLVSYRPPAAEIAPVIFFIL